MSLMKRATVLLAVLSVIGLGLVFAFRSGQAYTNFPPSRAGNWVAFGDSLTSGQGASEGNDYPTLLSKKLGIPIRNLGAPGATTADALARLDEVLSAQPKVVLVCFGGNDTLNGVPHSQTFQNLSEMIDTLHHSGAFVVLIGIRTASLRDKYRGEFKTLAREKRVLYVPNILQGVLGDPRLMSDYVHPNDLGYAAIAARLEEILLPLLPDLGPN